MLRTGGRVVATILNSKSATRNLRSQVEALTLDQPNVARARTLLRLFRRELDSLALSKQLEYRSTD